MTATASERAAFTRAVVSDPADDTVRLVYADWLQENGEAERAEFIRVQCELARLEATWEGARAVKHAKRDGLRRRERELFALDQAQGWYGFLLDGLDRHMIENRMEEDAVWRRGFIDELHAGTDGCDMERCLQLMKTQPVTVLTCPGADWLTHAPAGVKTVKLTTLPEIETRGSDGGRTRDVCRLAGRTWRPIPHGDGEVSRTLAILHDEFPGVEFVLPPLPAG